MSVRNWQNSAHLLVSIGIAATAIGCSSPPFQRWFIEHIALTADMTELPPGVTIDVAPNEQSLLPAEYLEITNSSSVDLYIVATRIPLVSPTGPQYVPPPDQLPGRHIPAFKLAFGRELVWSVTSLDPPWEYGWAPVDEYGLSDKLQLEVSGNQLTDFNGSGFHYVVAEFESRNTFDYGGNRPSDVDIPESHVVSFLMVYDGVEIELPITISYTLNGDYDNTSEEARSPYPALAVIAVAALIGLLIASAIVYYALMALVARVSNRLTRHTGR